jgi:hypothetical protein
MNTPTDPLVPFPLIPEQPDVEFRFTIKTARLLERATRQWGGISGLTMRGNNVEVLVTVTHHALLWNKPKLAEDKVIDWIQDFIDAGGNVIDLTQALTKALDASGVYGRPEGSAESEGDANPQTVTPEAIPA